MLELNKVHLYIEHKLLHFEEILRAHLLLKFELFDLKKKKKLEMKSKKDRKKKKKNLRQKTILSSLFSNGKDKKIK